MSQDLTPELNKLVSSAKQGDVHNADEITPSVFQEVRGIARALLREEAPGQTLQATALASEAFVRIAATAAAKGLAAPEFNDRVHVVNTMRRVMKHILIDRARRVRGLENGGIRAKVDIDCAELDAIEVPATNDFSLDQIEALYAALEKLRQDNPRQAEIVELKYFAGQTEVEIAQTLGIGEATVRRDWRFARAWLHDEVNQDGPRKLSPDGQVNDPQAGLDN